MPYPATEEHQKSPQPKEDEGSYQQDESLPKVDKKTDKTLDSAKKPIEVKEAKPETK